MSLFDNPLVKNFTQNGELPVVETEVTITDETLVKTAVTIVIVVVVIVLVLKVANLKK